MFEGIKITWYGWMTLGSGIGVYIHCHLVRHWLHLLATKVLRGFIWMLQKTDSYYQEPEVKTPKQKYIPSTKGYRMSAEELEEWLEKNPELSVTKR